MKSNSKKYLLFTASAILFAFGVVAYADYSYTLLQPLPNIGEGGYLTTVSGGPGEYITFLMKFVVAMATVFAVFMITLGGVQYLMSTSTSKTGAAKTKIKDALFGLALVLLSWLFLNTINPKLLEFNLNIDDLALNELAETPTMPGFYYVFTTKTADAEGNVSSKTEYSGITSSLTQDNCERARLVSKNTPAVTVGAACTFITTNNGPWYFEYDPEIVASEYPYGFFETLADCNSTRGRFSGSSDVESECRADPNIVSSLGWSMSQLRTQGGSEEQYGDGFYYVKSNGPAINYFSEKFETFETCKSDQERDGDASSACRAFGDGLVGTEGGGDGGGGGSSGAVACLDDEASCIPIVGPPVKNASSSRIHISLSEKIKVLHGKTSSNRYTWQITEAYPPTRIHRASCQLDGTCFDANFTGATRTQADSTANVPNAIVPIKNFIIWAQESGLRAVYETVTLERLNELKEAWGPNFPTGAIIWPGNASDGTPWISAAHFSVYSN